mmetsp:Transcript_10795/g.23008  ORF Transcript_10795/g.23008 Transcript_10795/m.23008 type:complete len:238 (-) Transcript_10795:74-787(-)
MRVLWVVAAATAAKLHSSRTHSLVVDAETIKARKVRKACPQGMKAGKDGMCEDLTCDKGYKLVQGGYCKPDVQCPPGFIEDPYGDFCAAKECPEHMFAGQDHCTCEALNKVTTGVGEDFWCTGTGCPAGMMKSDDGSCFDKPCNSGFYRSWTGWCEPRVCPQGMERDRFGFCADKVCGLGQMLVKGDCVAVPAPAPRYGGRGAFGSGGSFPERSGTGAGHYAVAAAVAGHALLFAGQ